MPVIKSAIKKLRQDKRRKETNDLIRRQVEITVSKAKKETKDFAVIAQAYSAIDKAVKNGLFEKNKAAHMKSALSKNVKPQILHKATGSAKKSTKKSSTHA